MKVYFPQISRVLFILVLVTACQEEITPIIKQRGNVNNPNKLSNAFYESFESVNKFTYEPGTRELSTGEWYFEDALIGEELEDNRYNESAIRIRKLWRCWSANCRN